VTEIEKVVLLARELGLEGGGRGGEGGGWGLNGSVSYPEAKFLVPG
jgi:hypothetical protein